MDEAIAPRSSLHLSPRHHCWRCCNHEWYNWSIPALDGFDRASGGQEREEEEMAGGKLHRHIKCIGQAISAAFNRWLPLAPSAVIIIPQ